ncbi:MAG: MATE family efflux transporter [Thermodesulfobacteriota bacterium]
MSLELQKPNKRDKRDRPNGPKKLRKPTIFSIEEKVKIILYFPFEMNSPSPNDRITDLTMGSLWVNIWQLSWPMLLIMIFNFFVGFTDIYVAGLINPMVQAAVGFIGQLYFLLIIIANAISIGTVALVARSIGAGNLSKAIENSKQSLIFGAFIAIGLTAAGLIFYREIIATAGFPMSIREIAETFLRIFAFSLGPNYLLIISNAVFRASGEVQKPLLTMFLVSAINIVGDFGLVFGIFPFPKMGYRGIALATAISASVGMVINFAFFFSHHWKSIYTTSWTISSSTIKRIANLSWPSALLQIAWNAGTIVLYNILGRLGDTGITVLASITNGLRIEAIIFLPAFALNMAASVLVGQNLGAGKADRASKVGWDIALVGMVLLSLMAFVIFMRAHFFASILAKEAAVLEETTRYLRINMISVPFMALSLILGGGLQGAGDTKGAMWVIIIGMWFIRLPLAFLVALVLGYGATGVWVVMVISLIFQGTFMAFRFGRGRWKGMKVD